MNTKLHLISVLSAGLALHGAAMPTEAEVEKAVPKVERMLASEKVALASGKMTRAEVAAAAMKRAAETDDEAAKLLLMKGAFILHVKDGDLEKAVKTMNALETAIADMPPQIVTNIIETGLQNQPKKAISGARLYRLLDEAKVAAKVTVADGEDHKAVVGGYTWTYRVKNGEAEIVAEKDGKNSCAVSPAPTGSISIPSTLGGAKVTRIGERAFAGCSKDLTSVSIPAGVTHIGAMAFSGCSGLTSVAIPASVRSIGKHPFCWSPRISKITVDGANHFYRAENDALYNKAKTNLIYWPRGKKAVVEIPSSVTNIESWAFLQCDGFSSVTIPSGVMRIGDFAFCACTELMSVTICGERPTAPDKVFRDCSKLKSIHVPANAKSWAGMKEWQGIPLVFDAK